MTRPTYRTTDAAIDRAVCRDAVIDRFRIDLESFWNRSGIDDETIWDPFGIELGSIWDRLGIDLRSLRDRFGIALHLVQDRFGGARRQHNHRSKLVADLRTALTVLCQLMEL